MAFHAEASSRSIESCIITVCLGKCFVYENIAETAQLSSMLNRLGNYLQKVVIFMLLSILCFIVATML